MKQAGKNRFTIVRSAASIAGGITLTAASLIALMLSANARGSHESEPPASVSSGMHGAQFAGGRRHGNDAHMKAAMEERDRLLSTQLKSICRGC